MEENTIIFNGIVDIESNPFAKYQSWREENSAKNSKGSGRQMQTSAIANFQKVLDKGGRMEDIKDDHTEKYPTFQAIRWKVEPAFRDSKIDVYLDDLSQYDELTVELIPKVLKVHHYLTQLTASITALEKRSFSSKYLHFHLPNLFFIYDSRVVDSMRQFIGRVPKPMEIILQSEDIDKEYAKFVCKGFVLREEIKKQYNIELTTRQFDNILIDMANDKMNSFNNI